MNRHVLLKAAAVLSYFSFYLLVSTTPLNAEQARFFWLWYGIPSLLILLIPKRSSVLARGIAMGQGMYFCLQAILPLALALPSNGLSNGMVSLLGFVLAQALLVFAVLSLGWPLKTEEIVPLICGARLRFCSSRSLSIDGRAHRAHRRHCARTGPWVASTNMPSPMAACTRLLSMN